MKKLSHSEIPRVHPDALDTVDRMRVTIVLDDIRSVHNVGSIFRTSDAFLVEEVILTGITCSADHPGINKTALGAQDGVPWSRRSSALEAVDEKASMGYSIGVLELTDSPTSTLDLSALAFPLCLVVGNEVFGVSDAVIDRAEVALEIPQYGTKQSLNVSVAFGIAAHAISAEYRRR